MLRVSGFESARLLSVGYYNTDLVPLNVLWMLVFVRLYYSYSEPRIKELLTFDFSFLTFRTFRCSEVAKTNDVARKDLCDVTPKTTSVVRLFATNVILSLDLILTSSAFNIRGIWVEFGSCRNMATDMHV